MNTLSFWEKQSFFNDTDVAIIGSGIVGLSAALSLRELDAGVKITVIERGALPTGASTKNAGFACFGSMTEILDDLKNTSEPEVFTLVERRWKGLLQLRSRIGDKKLRYQPFGGYEIFKKEEEATFEQCLSHLAHFNAVIESFTGEKNTYSIADDKLVVFGFKNTSHLIINRLEGQIDTGEMMKHLLKLAIEKDIQIINGIDVSEVHEEGDKAQILTTQGWSLSAGKALVATNGFARRFFPQLELWPARNQVLITRPVENMPFRGSFHYNKGYVYFRNVDVGGSTSMSRILLGGARNLALDEEKTEEPGTTPIIQNALTRLLHDTILPGRNVEIEGWWSGTMGLGPVKKPIIRMISPRIGVAARMGGMGVALGSLVGKEAADMIFLS